MMKERKFVSEAGAIMLELIAVLSLMGLMGAMLFRQIYKRNEELNNIQMASEIRVVKEGFAAWIQASKNRLRGTCHPPVGQEGDVVYCEVNDNADVTEIESHFLPDGYFTDAAAGHLNNSYNLFLVAYYQDGTANSALIHYGVVVPTINVLPDGGEVGDSWNFRRAARVAMLIGVDGGVYGSFSGDHIQGAVGTWELDNTVGPVTLVSLNRNTHATYVAITGVDVYQPEVDMAPVQLGIPDNWRAVFENAAAYGKFMVGTDTDCYQPYPTRKASVDPATGVVTFPNDDVYDISSSCQPAFYVEPAGSPSTASSAGNVYVLNDLHVGYSVDASGKMGPSAIRFDKNGMIVFENAEVVDPQSSGATANDKKINYVLDPQYTSVMNDIKVMSRGGARLSELLPNYILKGQTHSSCVLHTTETQCAMTASVTCPKGYKAALVIIPTTFGGNIFNLVDGTGAPSPYVKTSDASNTSVSGHSHTVSFQRRRMRVTIGNEVAGVDTDPSSRTKDFSINVGYLDQGGTLVAPAVNEGIFAIIQTYCVYPGDGTIDWD